MAIEKKKITLLLLSFQWTQRLSKNIVKEEKPIRTFRFTSIARLPYHKIILSYPLESSFFKPLIPLVI